jgi:hypothetical protein
MRTRFTYANVMSTLAVFVALGGTSYAAAKFTGSDIKDGTVTGRDLKDSTVAGGDIRDNTLTSTDVKDGSLQGDDLDPSALPARASTIVRTGGTSTSDLGAGRHSGGATAQCLPGEVAIGGGVSAPSGQVFEQPAVLASVPVNKDGLPASEASQAVAWSGQVEFTVKSDGTNASVAVWAICAKL